jgi:N-acyl-L-homoserine lactone synthetase
MLVNANIAPVTKYAGVIAGLQLSANTDLEPVTELETTKVVVKAAPDAKVSLADAIEAANQELTIEIATTPEQVLEAQRLRYRVYCQDRNFLEGSAEGVEQDAFDDQSAHVLVRNRATGEALGTVRIVLTTEDGGMASVPMAHVCAPHLLSSLPAAGSGEVSRFALTRERTGVSSAAASLMRLALVRGLIEASARNGVTHWCAIMERSLLRLLRSSSIYFETVGPAVEYHGLRQPVINPVSTILNRIRLEQPALWNYLTDGGALWPEHAVAQDVAA